MDYRFASRSDAKRCAFCGSEDLFDVDHVGNGITYLCKCGAHTYVHPPLPPFPWGSFIGLIGFFILAYYCLQHLHWS